MAQSNSRGYLFEAMPIPKAVMVLSVPMVVYNLAAAADLPAGGKISIFYKYLPS